MVNQEVINGQLAHLKELDEQIVKLSEQKEVARKALLEVFEAEGVEQYKNELATVSFIEKQTVKIKDEDALIRELQEQKLPKYYQQTVILKPQFSKDIKAGVFSHPLVEVQTSKNIQVRFNDQPSKN